MALPMLKEIIQTVHRLAAACKKHKGIVFIDENGNIIQDDSPEDNIPEEDDSDGPYNSEITGVITGVDKTTGNTHKQKIHEDTTGVDTENTGVDTENTSSIREQEQQTTHMTN